MTTLEKNTISDPGNRCFNETSSESLQFSGYPPCRANEDLFRIAKRINQSLEESYDQLRNDNVKIASRLWVCSASDHFALVDNQESDLSSTENLQTHVLGDLTIV